MDKRDRFLSPAELKRVGEVLREMEAEDSELPSGGVGPRPRNDWQAARAFSGFRLPARYAHLAAEPILAAANQVSAEIAILLNDHAA